MSRPLPAVALAVALVASACRHRADPAPSPSASVGFAPIPGFPVPKLLAKLHFGTYSGAGNLGVPAGCTLEMPVRSAPLPSGAVRFIAPPAASSELFVAVDEDGDGMVDANGVLDATGNVLHALPWSKLDAPPIVAKSAAGYVAVDTEDTGKGTRRAMLWHEPGRVEPLVQGDALEVVDAACDGSTCAVLTTLASTAAGPGATVLVGDVGTRGTEWTRTDVPPEDKAWTPLSLVRVKGGAVWVALAGNGALSVVRIEAGRALPVGRMDSEFGAYEIVLGEAPIAVAPGESVQGECKKDGFPIRLLTPGGAPVEVDGQVPPTSVLTRPLEQGFLVGWLSPVSCRHDGRDFVRAFLVSGDGKPRSSTMAVADASGFALATHGDAVDLWLAIGRELVWARARCRVSSAPVESEPPRPAEPAGARKRGRSG